MIAKKKKDAYRFPTRVFARLLGSFILSSMITMIGSIIDGFLTGRLMGGTEVGACGLVSPLCYIFALIGGMVCSGMENTVSKQLMKGQKREAQDTFAQALLIGMAFALAVTSLLLILNRPMTMLLGARPGMDVFEPCRDYLIGTSVGLPAMTMMTILACGAQLEGENRWAMASVIAVTVTNVTGDCIGIFFFHQGLFTLALISSFSYYIGAAVLLLRLRKADVLLKPKWTMPKQEFLKQLIATGLPQGFCWITAACKVFYINHIMATFMTAEGLAGYYVQIQVSYLTNVFFLGVAQTVVTLTCVYYREEDREALLRVSKQAMIYLVVVGAVISGVLLLCSRRISGFYLSTDSELMMVVSLLAVALYALSLVPGGITTLFAHYLRAIGHPVTSMIMYLMADVVFVILAVSYARSYYENLLSSEFAYYDEVIISGTFLGLVWASVLSLLMIPLIAVIINRRFSLRWSSLLMLPRSFGVPKEDEMLASVHCLEDAAACSAKAGEFCRQRNISERRSYAISLAIEEMASNVIQHGFADGKSHRLELRLAKKNERLILFMRDNCRAFDPKAFYQTMYTGEDPDSFLGIHIVMSTAREVNYTSTFGLNTLTIWV